MSEPGDACDRETWKPPLRIPELGGTSAWLSVTGETRNARDGHDWGRNAVEEAAQAPWGEVEGRLRELLLGERIRVARVKGSREKRTALATESMPTMRAEVPKSELFCSTDRKSVV